MPHLSETDPEVELDIPEGRVLPLNSQRLTAAQLKAPAKALGLSGRWSLEDLRLGKVRENGHSVADTQVILQEASEGGTPLYLLD